LSPCGMYRRLLLSLNDRAYGMPSRLQDAAGSRNRRKDAALEAVGITLATEFRDSCSRRLCRPDSNRSTYQLATI